MNYMMEFKHTFDDIGSVCIKLSLVIFLSTNMINRVLNILLTPLQCHQKFVDLVIKSHMMYQIGAQRFPGEISSFVIKFSVFPSSFPFLLFFPPFFISFLPSFFPSFSSFLSLRVSSSSGKFISLFFQSVKTLGI